MDARGPYRNRPRELRAREPGVYDCPACGLRLGDDRRACPSCGAPIATVRCARCFHMNVPEAPLCSGCGHELGLEPVGEPDPLVCPDCKRPLEAFAGEGGTLRDCGQCGGQFVDHALLEALLVQREVYGARLPKSPPRHNPLDSPVRYLPCPECQEVMMRKNFGRSSGIIVDVCVKHGVWFDAGELPRVLAFVEAGGLELARRRDADQRKDAERRERVAAFERQLAPLSAPASLRSVENAERMLTMADAGASLLGFVRQLLSGR